VDRLEAEDDDFFERIHETYLELAAEEPERIRSIDGSAALDQVLQAALSELADLI
jgi:dTMP kinase